ncbi:MAG: TolC family protein, partial [Gammaproteobacteria bacterium]
MTSRHLRFLALCVATSIGTIAASAADGTSVQAERAPAAQTSLTDLISELSRTNPEIRAARHRYEAALKRPSQVRTLPDPKATYVDFGVGHPFSSLGVSNFAYRAVGVSQEIPFPGKLSLAGEQARREAESEGQMYRATVVDVTARLKIAFFDWFAISKAIEVTNRNRDLLDRFEKIARARYSVGKGIQQDVLKAQVEISRLVQQLEVFEQRRASTEAQINALLNRVTGIPLGKPPELKRSRFDMDLDALLAAVTENSPQLRATQFLVESRSVGVERARLDYRPDFNFSFQWQRTATGFPDYYMATAEVKLPIYFWRKQRFAVEEAAARLEQSRHEYQA